MPAPLNVLIACEFSAIVREAFNRLGHHAWSVDLLETEIPGNHHQGDALEMLDADQWDLVIAHPPCTYLTNSGVRWLYGKKGGSTKKDPVRWQAMHDGCDFFAAMYNCKAERVAVENPVMHGYASDYLSSAWRVPAFTQSIQPYQFGHHETKRTCLWLRGLSPLVGTDDVESEMRAMPKSQTNRVHLASPGPDRWAMRSRTFPGIAEAMALQWGGRVTRSAPVNVPAVLPISASN
jgi:hypothetical protein